MKRYFVTPLFALICIGFLGAAEAFGQFGEDFGSAGIDLPGPRHGFQQRKTRLQPEGIATVSGLPPKASLDIEALRQKLEVRTTIELDENVTFEQLFGILKEKHGIQSIIDPRGAGALGIVLSSPVVREPFRLEDVPLRRILQIILREQDLTYVIDEGFLQITSEDEAKKYMKVKVYQVADLVFDPHGELMPTWVLRPVDPRVAHIPQKVDPQEVKMVWENHPISPYDFTELMDLIEAIVAPDSWDDGGEMMEFYPGLCLVVLQTDEVHDQVENLLAELRAKRAEPSKKISESKTADIRRGPHKRHPGFGARLGRRF